MERRAAGALLALAACFACSAAAPTASNQTSLDLYEGAPEGCYYNFQHYGEGDRIMTNEPCLNCTCHNRMLMCYLRVCPFTKAIGQDCTVEKRADQCCPIVTCPDVPVDLLTSTSTTSPAEYGATGLGKLDKYGCSINDKYFPEGSKVPPTPNKPCEHCYCIRNMTTCVMQECTLHVDGCTPIYHKDVCCPVRYSCDHQEDEMPLLDDMSTTVRPTPGFLLTTTTVSPVTQMTQDCVHDDQIFADGALIKTEKACEHCYCMKGDIVCVVQECGAPMENEGKNCTSLPPREGQCCPDTYICEGDELSSEVPTEVTTESVMEMITTLLPPRRGGVEGSGYRNEPDEASYTAIPTIDSEIEGSGEDQDTSKPEEGLETIPPTEDGEQFISVTKGPMSIHEEQEHATTESVKYTEDQTSEPHDNVATTISPIEKVTDKLVTDDVAAELKPYEHYTTTSTEKIATEHGEFLNTVPDEVPEVDDTKPHVESTTSEPTIEGSGSPSPTEIEDGKTTITSEKGEVVTVPALEYNTPTVTPETITEKELLETDKDITRTTVTKVEEYTEKSEIESSTSKSYIPTTTNVPVEDTKLTTEPDHAQNTVAVAEEEITDSHIPKVTSVPDSSVEGEKTTVANIEQDLTTERTVQDEVSKPSELVPTATTALRDNELSTEEPDKGLNTIPNEVNEESTSAFPHLIETKTTESATHDVDLKQTTILETVTLTPEIMVTKGDQYTVTTEPSFRKEDEISVSTKKTIDFVSTTVRPEFVDEGLIPTSTHDEKIGSSSEVPSLDEDITTLIPEYIKDLAEAEGTKPTTPELIPDVSDVTESVPVKHSEPSEGHEGETLSSTEKSTETTAFVVEDVETHEEPSRIPGEGDCLLNGVTYRNNSVVPSTNNCHSDCRCASSIIKCDPIICSPPPDYMDNCQSIYDSPDSCCPTYVCDHPRETVPPQSDNQMSGTESPLSSPTIECRGDQCEIIEPVKQSTDRTEACTGESCSGETDHKSELPHTIPKCENEEDCKSMDIPVQEATPCEGDSCKKIDCAGDNCDPNAVFVHDHKPEIPQDIPVQDCTGEEPCRRKETADTSAKVPSECDGPNCISETDITVQDVVYSSTKSSVPTEEVTERIEVTLGEKTTEVPESPTKDTQELDSYTTEKQFDTMKPDKEAPEVTEDVDTKKPISIDDEVTGKPEVSDNADKETITEKPTLIDEDVKTKPTGADEEVTYTPALTDDDEKRTSVMVDEITEKPTVTDEDIKAKPTVNEGDVTEKPALTDEDGTQETITDIPTLIDDGGKGSSTEIEEEITEKPSLTDDEDKVKPPVIDEDITEKPSLIDDDGKKQTTIHEGVTEKPLLIDDAEEEKATVIDEEVTKKPELPGDDEKETPTDVAEQVTDKPAVTEEDGKVTSVAAEEITKKPVADEDDKQKPPVTDEDITGKPDLIDDGGKATPTIIDEDVTGVTDKPDITDEDGKIKQTVIAEDVTDKPDLIDDVRRKPTDTEEKITEKPALTDDHDKVQPTVIDEDVTGKPDLIDEDGKVKPAIIDEDVTGKPDFIDEEGKIKPTVIDEDVTDKPDLIDEDGKIKPNIVDEDVTGKPDLIDEDGKIKPTVIDEGVTGKPDLIDEDVTGKPDSIADDGKLKPTVVDEDVTGKPDFIDVDGKIKPTVIDEGVTGKPDLIDDDVTGKPDTIDEDGKPKPTVIDEDITGKPELTDEDGKAKPTVIDQDVTDKPALTDDDGRRKPTDTEENITEKSTLTDDLDKEQPTVIDEYVTDKPVQIDEDGLGKPNGTDEETTKKPTLIDDGGMMIPTVIDEDITQKPASMDDDKQTPAIQEGVTEKPDVYDDAGKETSATEEEITKKPSLTDEDGKIKPIDEDVTDKPTDTQEKVTVLPVLIDNDGKESSTVTEEEVTKKPGSTDEESKIKPSVMGEDVTEKTIQTDEDDIKKPTDDTEKGTEKPVLIDDDGKETSPVMEDIVTEKPTSTDIDVKETYTAIQEEVTEKSTLTGDVEKEKPTEIYEEITDKPTLTDEDSKIKPTVPEEEITKKPVSIDDDGKVKPTEEGEIDESINEITKKPQTETEEGSGTELPEIERTKPETEAQTPEILVHPTDSTTSELQEVTKTPYHESTTTHAADGHAFSTESNIEPADVTTSASKDVVPSESPEIGETEYATKMPTKSQPEQEVTTVGTYETTPNMAITSDQEIEKETYDITSPKQDVEEKSSTTAKPTIGEQEETSTDMPDLESLVTRKQEGGSVEIEPQEGPADDKHKQPESGSIDDEMTTKMYDDGKIKPVPESHVTEQAMAVTPAYDSISEQPDQASELPEMQDDKTKVTEIPDSEKTKDEEYITEQDKTITETPALSVDVSTESQIPLETQKISDEGTPTTIKSYLPETGSTELPDKAIGEVMEHSTQASEANKDKPDILTGATEEPISVVTESQEMFPTSEKDVTSHGEKTTSVPDITDDIHKGTTPVEEYTQEQDAVTDVQHHFTTEESHSKAPETYITGEYVTGIPEGPKEDGSDKIPTDIPRTSEKAQETTEAGVLFTESHDHEMKEPSVTEIQEQSTRLPITSVDLETERPEVQVTSETPQSLVTGQAETTTGIFKEDSQEPELVTSQVQETTKTPELPVFVSVQEELQTKAPVSMTEPEEHDIKETATEITEETGKVTKVPEETVTEKHETLTTLRESSSPTQEEFTEKPQVDTKQHETTESQAETSETTTDLIILEEHTHKIAQEITTELPTDNEVTDLTGDISTLPPHEEHTTKITESIPSESPIDEEKTTVHDLTEHQYSEQTTEKSPEQEIEVATKETEIEMKPSEETPIEGVTEKILDTVAIDETTAPTVQDVDSKYTIAHKEYTTSAPTQVSEETTPEASTEPAIVPVSEIDITGSSTKEPSVTEKPTHATTVPEDELIFSTTKATTVREGEETSDDKVAKPEDKPSETSEVPPTSTTAEVQKPIVADAQPTEKIPEPEEEFPSMGPNGYGEPDYVEEDQAFGPGTCRYGGKVYVSAQQIPRDDPCDFCFCFRSDIICLQQSCPPPIHGCHEEPIQGFCCPRYECPVSMATTVNVTTTTTTTTTTLPPHFPTHSYKGAAQRRGCQIKGHTYKVGEVVRSSSGPCLHCTCGGDGQMKCDPKACTPEPMLRQMIAAAVSAKRRR